MTSCGDLRILFRAAAGPRRGFGHLVRCRSLARALGVRPLVALRGGQGAHFVLPVAERVDLQAFVRGFQGQTLATAMQGESLYEQDLRLPTAFLIGNEGTGLSEGLMTATDCRIRRYTSSRGTMPRIAICSRKFRSDTSRSRFAK